MYINLLRTIAQVSDLKRKVPVRNFYENLPFNLGIFCLISIKMLDRDDYKYHHGYWDGPNSSRKWMILKLLFGTLFIVGSLFGFWTYLDPLNTQGKESHPIAFHNQM
jgi:hypothetical protein